MNRMWIAGALVCAAILLWSASARADGEEKPAAPAAAAAAAEAEAEAERPEPEPAQKTCPVMGGAVDKKIFVDHEGRRIYFCCAGCVKAFQEDPARYLAKVDAELEALRAEAVKAEKEKAAEEAEAEPDEEKPATEACASCGKAECKGGCALKKKSNGCCARP